MATSLAHTPLHDWHAAHGGRLVDFAGWGMPVQYTSIVAEHQATRTAAGVFDVSHMGRLSFEGPGAERFLDRIATRRVAGQRPGVVRYALVTDESGGILDDVLVYALAEGVLSHGAVAENSGSETSTERWLMVVNAGNRSKIVDWLTAQGAERECQFSDQTVATAMIAVQGPLSAHCSRRSLATRRKSCAIITPGGSPLLPRNAQTALVSRTGYTGEDGWELIVAADAAVEIWQKLLAAGEPLGAVAAGLGARDTLRLEAAMPLYGHELSESIDPFQAGLGFAVDLEGRGFPGRDALARLRDEKSRPVRVGWQLADRRVPREGYPVLAGDRAIGHVTSGTFSPTLEKPIAMGYTQPAYAEPGTEVVIDIRGRQQPARVVTLPFYRRPTAGSKK